MVWVMQMKSQVQLGIIHLVPTQISEKLTLFTPWNPQVCTYQGRSYVRFWENSARVLNGWPLSSLHFFKTYVYLLHNPSSSSFEKETFCTCCCHCVKSVEIQSYFWSLFFCIQSEYRKYGPKITLYLDTVCTQAVCVQKNFWTLSDEKILKVTNWSNLLFSYSHQVEKWKVLSCI